MDTELILCGVDGTGFMVGSSLGPLALWQLGLEDAIRAQSNLKQIHLLGPHTLGSQKRSAFPPGSGLTIFEAFDWIESTVDTVLDMKDVVPVICHGDHTFSAASAGRAVARIPELHLLWIDAHADLNTPATSPSGNLHGMPAAMLMHDIIPTASSFKDICKLLPESCINSNRLHYWGVRDLDPSEREILSAHPGFKATMSDVDRQGTTALVDKLLERLPNKAPLWISFDIDCVDPLSAPATGTPVPEGLTKREAFTLAEILADHAADGRIGIAGVEIVEVNPLRDKGRSCDFAISWLACILGKTILSRDEGSSSRSS